MSRNRPVRVHDRNGGFARAAGVLISIVMLGFTSACTSSDEADDVADAAATLDAADTMVRIGLIDWTRDYDEGLERARRLGKPLLLHFGEHPG